MIKTFGQFNISLSSEEMSKLNTFGDYLCEYNQKINLTTVTQKEEMWIKHFLDSCLGAELIKQNASCCEIGSGGGFPSIPLKILRDDLSFTLIESTGKKCDYLKSACEHLGLDKMTVVCARAEELSRTPEHRDMYDVAVARAVARLNTLCEYCMPFVKVGGLFIAYKAEADEELKEAENAVKTLGGRIREVKKVTLPDGVGVRNIIVIEKLKSTPAAYPRGNGKERKKPL